MIKTRKKSIEKTGLPASIDTEKFVLGTIINKGADCPIVAQVIQPDDMSLDSHKRILAAMIDLQMREEVVDRVTLANELISRGELDLIGGLSYLIALDEGLPQTPNLEAYLSIIKEKSRLRKVIKIASNTYTSAIEAGAISEEIIIQSQQALLKLSDSLDSKGQQVDNYVDTFVGGSNLLLDPSKQESGIMTGFRVLDEWTNGFHPSEIFLIGARPGVGKSSIALNIARNVSRRYGLVVFFSLEMPKKVCVDRLICDAAEVSFLKFRSGTLSEDDRRQLVPALNEVVKLPIFLDDRSGLTVPEISMTLQALATDMPVVLCVIDYVQLLRTPKGQRYSTLNEKFEQITEDLQRMSKRNKIPLLLLSQLNRESTKGKETKPKLSEVRNSGTFEQIANFGGCLHRPGMSEGRGDKAILIVEKNRSGTSGDIPLLYRPTIMRFEDVTRDD